MCNNVFNTELVKHVVTAEMCLDEWRRLKFEYGDIEYVQLKMMMGDGKVKTDDDNTRFWICSPLPHEQHPTFSLAYMWDWYTDCMNAWPNYMINTCDKWYEDVKNIDFRRQYIPLFCNTEYDNWIGFSYVNGAWKLLQIDLSYKQVYGIYDGIDDLIRGVRNGSFGSGVQFDDQGRIVLTDMHSWE